jgi:GDPmannose 4,6-dehydratase
MNRSALIIGCEGQDGFLLSKYLKEIGYSVYGSSYHKSSSNVYLDKYIRIDLCSADSINLKSILLNLKPAEIYYLAAHHISSQEYESIDEKELKNSLSVNYTSFQSICSICSSLYPTVKIVYTSSSLIFAKSEETICSEQTRAAPGCFYSLYKLFSMETARYFRRNKGLHVSNAIMFNHESKHRKEKYLSKVIVNQVRQYVKGEIQQIKIGNLYAETDWGYAGDYVHALWHINQLTEPDDFVVASGKSYRVIDWFYILEKHTGIELMPAIVEMPIRLGREKPILIGDRSKLVEMGWKPEVSFQQMVINLYDGIL